MRPGARLLLPWLLLRLAVHPGWQHPTGQLLLLGARQVPLYPVLLALLRLCRPSARLPTVPAAQPLVLHSKHAATTLLAHGLQEAKPIGRWVAAAQSLLIAAQAS